MSGAVSGLIQSSNRFGIVHTTWNTTVSATPPGHYDGNGAWSLSNGNLTAGVTTNSGLSSQVTGTTALGAGKWYWEITIVNSSGIPMLGIEKSTNGITTNPGATTTSYSYQAATGNKVSNSAGIGYGSSFTNGDVIGVAFDNINSILWFSKNGTWQASATITEVQNGTTTHAAYSSIASGTYYACVGPGASTAAISVTANFGGTNFAQTCPIGFTGLY